MKTHQPTIRKFDYPQIVSTDLNKGRVYEVKRDLFFPSITTVLGATVSEEKKQSLEKWKKSIGEEEATRILIEAGRVGTQVHLMAERFLQGLPPWTDADNFDDLAKKRFNSIKMKLKNVTCVYGQEVALYSNELCVAGRTDLVGEWKNIPSIVDYKTSRRNKDVTQIGDYKLQLMFYAHAHNEMFGTTIKNGVILMASGDSLPQQFNIDLNDELLMELKDRINLFYDKLENDEL